MYIAAVVLLWTYALSNSFAHESNYPKNAQEIILCRKCGADIADSYYLFDKSSPGATKVEKQNLFTRSNVTVNSLVNPFGTKFEIVTIEKARCVNLGPRQSAESWFPGFSWRICACPHCGQHLGWTFEKLSEANNTDKDKNGTTLFYGLILHNILGENFTDSLIMMPNIYEA